MNLSRLQQKIVEANEDKIAVMAAAASGKTQTMVARLEKIYNEPHVGRVVAFTFTNMAAENIKERYGLFTNEDLFIGTIHSYVARLLLSKGISEAKRLLELEKFDELFSLVRKNPECIEPVSYIFLDEAQDTDKDALNIIFDYIKPKRYFFVYDLRQSIYRWRGADPNVLMQFLNNDKAKFYSLNENYRNARNILNFAKDLLWKTNFSDDSIAMRAVDGQVVKSDFKPSTIFGLMKPNDYKNWAILTRTNKRLEELKYWLDHYGIPYNTFKQGEITSEELKRMMNENKVKLLTVHSSKGLEFDNVWAIDVQRPWGEEEPYIDYTAATRAKELLIWTKFKNKRNR